ncbi:MAG: hypothetical protein U0359_35035 [Byssovorax sp.]
MVAIVGVVALHKSSPRRASIDDDEGPTGVLGFAKIFSEILTGSVFAEFRVASLVAREAAIVLCA